MRLCEVARNGQHLDNYPPRGDNFRINADVWNFFHKRGWKEIGSGFYSSVYSHQDKDFVVKINQRYDRAFAHFILLTHKFPNPHFPVISNVKLLKRDDGTKFYVYFMEKLNRVSDPSYTRYEDKIRWLMMFLKGRDQPKLSIEQLMNTEYAGCINYLKSVPHLWEAFEVIAKYGKGSPDLGIRNVMQRDDGTIVFVDPLAFGDIR